MNRLRQVSRSSLIQGLILLAGLAVLATLPFYGSIYATILLSTVFMYVVLTLSWAIFSGPTGQISLATAAFLGIGIYVAATLGKQLPLLVVVLLTKFTNPVVLACANFTTTGLSCGFSQNNFVPGTTPTQVTVTVNP